MSASHQISLLITVITLLRGKGKVNVVLSVQLHQTLISLCLPLSWQVVMCWLQWRLFLGKVWQGGKATDSQLVKTENKCCLEFIHKFSDIRLRATKYEKILWKKETLRQWASKLRQIEAKQADRTCKAMEDPQTAATEHQVVREPKYTKVNLHW